MIHNRSAFTHLVTGFTAVLATLLSATGVGAAEFGEQAIPRHLAIAVASPVRNGQFHTLMILEQIPQGRACWQEQGDKPVVVNPLLLTFDFTGSCDRKTDSNGYSLRVNGQDLAGQYRLEISTRQDDLVLFARPSRDRSLPALEIGRTQGRQQGFLKIQLNPGWQLTRRLHRGTPLGHIYLSHDQPLPGFTVGQAAPPSGPIPPPQPSPPPPARPPVNDGTYFRVVVPITGGDTLQRVRTVEPEAFATTVQGQNLIQVGLFRERQRAEEVYQSLVAANLPAKIINASAPAPASLPPLPTIPQGAVVVMIDPGHGGRDPGAIGIGGLQEKQINLTISQRVQQQLQAAGLTVLMTRSSDQWVDLEARAQYANRAGAAVFVSIHANAISMQRPEVNGLETYYLSSGGGLARSIHQRVLAQTDLADRGVRQARFYVLRHTTMPAVLVETGFVTGSVDAARFQNPAAVTQIADAIARGILDYLGR
jgi:N-acetylmuramoyl-L-alanine amidase